jgi:arylsulfatase A-like enzyme
MSYEDRPGFGRAVVEMPIRESGRHRMNGILIVKGKEIAKSVKINNAKIWDIAPTILYLMDIPIPSDMDGKVIKEIFDAKYLKQNPIKYEKKAAKQIAQQEYPYSKQEEEEIKKRLKALGYM